MTPPARISPVLDWQDGQPVSRRFGDVYFSRSSGLEETRRVFLAGNRLAARFADLSPCDRFVIGETGFGTGLNFLCAWELWERAAPRGASLHFVSTEQYPLSPVELAQATSLWPELDPWRAALLSRYGALTPGWHRMRLAGGRVLLTLLVGDARETLRDVGRCVDAWFLDGFSPACNPELWEPGVLAAVATASRPGATVATYTVAGQVRRDLAAVGFRVAKAPGFGTKREMLVGELPQAPLRAAQGERAAIVIGGGLAGVCAAFSLASRGWRATVVERHGALASEASGNPQAVLYVRLSASAPSLSRVALSGYQYALRLLPEVLPADGMAWSQCGMVQLASDAEEQRRQQRLLELGWPEELVRGVDAGEASEHARLPLPSGGLLFPAGAWVNAPALCAALVAHPGIALKTGTRALRLTREASGRWRVWQGDLCIAAAPVVVVAGASESTTFEQTAGLPLRTVRGQMTLVPATARSARLAAIVCGEGYVAPARAGLHGLGATFSRTSAPEVSAADNAENLAMLAKMAPSIHAAVDGAALDPAHLLGRAALRCVSPDHLPVVGAVGDQEGLYVSTAHGSRGLITAPLAGEILASALEHEPAPLPGDLLRAVDPARFRARAGQMREVRGRARSKRFSEDPS